MVVADVIGKQALQVAFIEGNNVIEQVPPATLDPPLSNSVLPGTLERRANRPDGHRAYRDRDLQTIFGIPVKDEEPRSRIDRERPRATVARSRCWRDDFACGEQHSILLKSQADIILAKDKALRRQFKEARL